MSLEALRNKRSASLPYARRDSGITDDIDAHREARRVKPRMSLIISSLLALSKRETEFAVAKK
jgi:hypothetical protein